MDYRTEYFKHNPGLFGCVWKCAYCGKLLVGRGNVEVDHVTPLNNPLGQNARYNLVAACQRCNREKSDKFDGRVAVGYASKIFDTIVFSIQKIFVIAFVAIWNVVCWIVGLPFRMHNPLISCIAVVVYVLIIYGFLKTVLML
jgi:hypothetical protein